MRLVLLTAILTIAIAPGAALAQDSIIAKKLDFEATRFAYDTATGYLFAVDSDGNRVVAIDPESGKTLKTYKTGAEPVGAAVKGDRLVTANKKANALSVFSIKSGELLVTIPLSAEAPVYISAAETNSPYVYVAANGAALQVDIKSLEERENLLGPKRSLSLLQVSRDGRSIVHYQAGAREVNIYLLDETRGEVERVNFVRTNWPEPVPGPFGQHWIFGGRITDITGKKQIGTVDSSLCALHPEKAWLFGLGDSRRGGPFKTLNIYSFNDFTLIKSISLFNIDGRAGGKNRTPSIFVDAGRDRVVAGFRDRMFTAKISQMGLPDLTLMMAKNPFPSRVREGQILRWTPVFINPSILEGARVSLRGAPAGMTLSGKTVVYASGEGLKRDQTFQYVLTLKGGKQSVLSITFSVVPPFFSIAHRLSFFAGEAQFDPVSGHLFILDVENERVVELDPDTGKEAASYATESGPTSLFLKGRFLAVTNSKADSVSVFSVDGGGGSGRSIKTTHAYPVRVSAAEDDDTDYAYVAGGRGHDGWVAQIDLKSATERKVIFTRSSTGACSLSRDGTLMYRHGNFGPSGVYLYRFDADKPELSEAPVARHHATWGYPRIGPHDRYWFFDTGLIADRMMTREPSTRAGRFPVLDPASSYVYSISTEQYSREAIGYDELAGTLWVHSINTFKKVRKVTLSRFKEPSKIKAKPQRNWPFGEAVSSIAVDAWTRRVLLVNQDKLYVIPIKDLALPVEKFMLLRTPFPSEASATVALSFRFNFVKGLGFDGATVSLKNGPKGMSVSDNTLRFTPRVGQHGNHALEFDIRLSDGSTHPFQTTLNVLPRFLAAPAGVSRMVVLPDGSAAALVHGGGRILSLLDLSSGELKRLSGSFRRVDSISFAGDRLIVSDVGILGLYDKDTREAKGKIRTGQAAASTVWGDPNDPDAAYAMAGPMVGRETQLLYLDLKRRISKPVSWTGKFTGGGPSSALPLFAKGEYLLIVGLRGMRIRLEGNKGTVIEPPAQTSTMVFLDPTRNTLHFMGLGLVSPQDLRMIYEAAPGSSNYMRSARAGSTLLPTGRLLASFDGYDLRFTDSWTLKKLTSVSILERPTGRSAAVRNRGGLVATSPDGRKVFVYLNGKVFEADVPDERTSVPETTFGRFKELPSSLEVKGGEKFSFQARATGLGVGTFYYLKKAPDGLKLDEDTGRITWTVPVDLSKPVSIQIGAKDDKDVEASLHFQLHPKK